MKFFALAAVIAVAAGVKLNKDDLPHGPKDDSMIDKLDPLSRYVNDDDILQVKSEVHGPTEDKIKQDRADLNTEIAIRRD